MSLNSHTAFCINLVKDCGADPTGATDCVPAFAAAFALMQKFAASPAFRPFADFTLYIPPGVYRCNAIIGTWDFLNKASSVRVHGHRTASIIQVADPAIGSAFWAIQNCDDVEVDHLCFTGTDHSSATWDCAGLMFLGARYLNHVHHTDVYNLNAFYYVFNFGSGFTIEEAGFYNTGAGTGAGSANFAVIYGAPIGASSFGPQVLIRNITTSDIGPLNGQSVVFSKVDTNKTWIRIDGTWSTVVVENSFIDEGCLNTLIVDPTINGTQPAARTGNVRIRGLRFNPPVLVGGVQGITLINVDKADLWYVRAAGNVPSISCLGVTGVLSCHAKNFFIDGVHTAVRIQADATSGEFLLEDGNVPVLRTALACSLPMAKNTGVLSDILTSGAAIAVAGQLVKLSAALTVIPLVVGDAGNVALVRGVTLDTAAGAGTPVRVVRPSQYATMLNDGAAPIALNATVAPSGAVAGRVAAAGATASHLGIAVAANAGALDSPVFVWYVPGNMGVV